MDLALNNLQRLIYHKTKQTLACAQPSPLLIPTLIDPWVIDLVSSPVWWEAVSDKYQAVLRQI